MNPEVHKSLRNVFFLLLQVLQKF